MATSGEDGYSCGYCLSEKGEMTDPKKLPCGHIFCLECLLHDVQKSPKIKCIFCSKEFENLDAKTLESVNFDKKTLCCDVCGLDSKANIWCITCSKSMCKEHAEVHDAFTKQFGLIHQTELLTGQSGMTHDCGKRLCTMHNSKVKGACSKCQSLLCFRCLAEIRCAKSVDKWHIIAAVHELSDNYKECLKKALCDLFDKMTAIDELEKKASCMLSEEKARCDRMKELVDEVLLEQKKLMMEKAEKIKLDIDSHYEGCTKQASDYVARIISTKEELDHVRKDIHELRQKSGFEVILQNNEMTDKSAKSLANQINMFNLPNQPIHRFEHKQNIEIELETSNQLKAQIQQLQNENTNLRNNMNQFYHRGYRY